MLYVTFILSTTGSHVVGHVLDTIYLHTEKQPNNYDNITDECLTLLYSHIVKLLLEGPLQGNAVSFCIIPSFSFQLPCSVSGVRSFIPLRRFKSS